MSLLFCSAGIVFAVILVSIDSLYLYLAIDLISIIFLLLFFMPLGKKSFPQKEYITTKVDERDTMFARMDYKPGDTMYERYYEMRPELKNIDDRIRKMPVLFEEGGKYYDKEKSRQIISMFDTEESNINKVDGKTASTKAEEDPEMMTGKIKRFAYELGAREVGITRLDPMLVYSHVGRGPEEWGKEIINNHKYAILFTVEMDHDMVEEAPKPDITVETARRYLDCQSISIKLAGHIRSLGWPARAHVSGSNYQVMLPPLARDAGLGEIGRIGYLISPRFGARVRIGAVTTDLPLQTDKPIEFGVQDFCEKCKKCAVNCPSGAITSGSKTKVRGVEKWQLNIENCYKYWRIVGSDCGLCMKVCPFSHPDNIAHNILRVGIKRSSFARWISVQGDDLFYGKKVIELH